MDDEIRNYFDRTLMPAVADAARAARAAETGVAELARRQDATEARTARLEKQVWSNPPPPASGPAPALNGSASLSRRVTNADTTADAHAAQLIVHGAQLAELLSYQRQQNRSMGLPTRKEGEDPLAPPAAPSSLDRVVAFATSERGVSFAIKLATLILATVTALAAYRAHVPPPPMPALDAAPAAAAPSAP